MMPILEDTVQQDLLDLIAKENELLLKLYQQHHTETGHVNMLLGNNCVDCFDCNFHAHAAGSAPARLVSNNGNVVMS